MRFYTRTHKHYCGIDLHARFVYICILDQDGEVLLHRKLRCSPEEFLPAIAPYREDLVVAVECIFTWYWIADLCSEESIAFVLGHALYMRAIHGAMLLRGGLMPQAYVYPPEMRATRDLMRRRLHFVRHRGQLLAHIQNTHHQYNRPTPGKRISYRSNRDGIGAGFEDVSIRESLAADLALINHYEVVIQDLEAAVVRRAKIHKPQSFQLLRSIPGTGKVLALTILYEIHDIRRFEKVGQFASYSRLVKCQKTSVGKIQGSGGAKIGNAYLKWAFSEAAVLFLAKCPEGKTLFARIERKHGKGKAMSILAHKLGRAVYFMLARKKAFDLEKFLRS